MADLTTTVTESVVLNGALRGNTNTVTTTGINNVFERIVTCENSQETVVALFAVAPYTSPAAIDAAAVKYIRITNLDADAWIEVAVLGTATSYTVLLTPGHSHILAQGEAVLLAEEDTSPSFGTLENLASIQVQPVGVSFDPRVEIFVGVAE